MKKRLVLLITLVVSLFIYSGRVEAGKEDIYSFNVDNPEDAMSDVLLNSMCGDGYSTCTYICKKENKEDNEDVTGDTSVIPSCGPGGVSAFYVKGFSRENQLSDLKEKLQTASCEDKDCYQYVKDNYCESHSTERICTDLKEKEGTSSDEGECFANIALKGGNTIKVVFNYSRDRELSIQPVTVNNVSFNGDEITAYNNIVYFYSKGSDFEQFKQQLLDEYTKNGNKCPTLKLCSDQNKNGYFIWYTELEKCDPSKYIGNDEQIIDGDGTNSGIDYNKDDGKNDDGSDVENCDDLFGPELLDKINDYFKLIKLVVPILLIGFGIYDFSKAVFENEEGMKKARQKFIMRIVAAVLFFLLPVFIKLILSLANNVWDFINPDTCIR